MPLIIFRKKRIVQILFDQYWDKVVLRMPFNTDLLDLKGNIFTSTNNPTLNESAGAFESRAMVLNGSSYLSTAASNFNMGSSDFAIEMRFKLLAKGSSNFTDLLSTRNGPGNSGFMAYINQANNIVFSYWTGSAENTGSSIISNTPITLNTWHFLVITRSGNDIRIFLDGINVGFGTITLPMYDSTGDFLIGAHKYGNAVDSTWIFNGYIDDLRITKGVARYTTNFNAPTQTLPTSNIITYDYDIYWSQTIVSMPMDGVNGGTTFTDVKGGVITRSGNAVTRTDIKKFGSASAYFDGNSGISVATNKLSLTNQDFTVECWIRTSDVSRSYQTILAQGLTSNTDLVTPLQLRIEGSNINAFIRDSSSAIGQCITTNSPITNNTWNHIAYVRIGINFLLFVNGVLYARATSSASQVAPAGELFVGLRGNGTNGFLGNIDDLRITKGVARYTTNFDVPVQANPIT